MASGKALRAALYGRVSTFDQEPENQVRELRAYVEARGWTAKEYVDRGVSGSKDSRPALDALVRDARSRRIDVVVTWSLDRMGRSLKHLVVLLDDLQALSVGFISVKEGLDWTTPTGRLQAQLLAMIAEFERARIQERVMAGLRNLDEVAYVRFASVYRRFQEATDFVQAVKKLEEQS